jgi:hypothetical protein
MLWRQKVRADAPAPKIRREWRCDDCGHGWRTTHEDGPESEGYVPSCEVCLRAESLIESRASGLVATESLVRAQQVFRPVAVNGNASRALDMAETMMRDQYGMTNMKDHLHQGETPVMAPSPIQTAEADAITREIINAGGVPNTVAPHLQAHVKNFWGAGGGGGAPVVPPAPVLAPQAAVAARTARNEGADPVAMLHAGRAGNPKRDPIANLRVHGSF